MLTYFTCAHPEATEKCMLCNSKVNCNICTNCGVFQGIGTCWWCARLFNAGEPARIGFTMKKVFDSNQEMTDIFVNIIGLCFQCFPLNFFPSIGFLFVGSYFTTLMSLCMSRLRNNGVEVDSESVADMFNSMPPKTIRTVRDLACDFCATDNAKNVCINCKLVFYCNEKCQQRHYKARHYKDCKMLARRVWVLVDECKKDYNITEKKKVYMKVSATLE